VLKLSVRPRQVVWQQAMTLRLAAGDGTVRLLRDDLERGAMLLERLGAPMGELGLAPERRHELLCDAAARAWRAVDPTIGLVTGAEKAGWHKAFIARLWEETGRPCGERAVGHAIGCADRRQAAHDDERAVLCHGDVQQWNTLQTLDGAGWKLIDPDGVRAEPEYDLGVIMREDPELDDADERADRLAARTGLDRTAIWEWGACERLSTGLYCTRVGFQPAGRQLLALADRIAAAA
jgi:streptomycin 6-kinase